MDENFKNILVMYKEYTLQIIKIIEADDLDSLEELIEKRQCLIDKALVTPYEKEENKKIYEELGLNELQDGLNGLMLKKLEVIRNEMQKISKSKMANMMYNKRNYAGAKIFSKKL
jgi:hypothetical protein